MGGDDQASGAADLAGVLAETVVAGAVAPVDERAGVRAERDDVAVTRRDLLAQQDQQVVARLVGPMGVRGMGVVLGGVDEVQARRAGEGRDLGGGAAAVGVPGVQVAVAAVPGAAAALGPRGRVRRLHGGAGFAVGERDGDLVRQSLRGHGVGAERDVPGALADRARDVAGRGVVGADEELRARAARPAAEALAAQFRAALVEDADVERVARGAGRDGGLLVRVRDLDLPYAVRDFDGQIHEVGGAGGQSAAHRLRLLVRCRVGGLARETHASQRKRGGGSRHEQGASCDAVVVLAHAAAPKVSGVTVRVWPGCCGVTRTTSYSPVNSRTREGNRHVSRSGRRAGALRGGAVRWVGARRRTGRGGNLPDDLEPPGNRMVAHARMLDS